MAEPKYRPIRSFVRREGRLTPGQQRALERLWPRFGIDVDAGEGPVDLDAAFGRDAPRVLEIGFGNGESLAGMATAEPGTDFLGVEVYRPGIGRLLQLLEERDLDNVRVAEADAVQFLRRVGDDALDGVHIFFPDPWPKKRHHKRRIVQPALVQDLRRVLKTGGRLHLATDWEDYARHMLEVMEGAEGFRNLAPEGGFSPRPASRPPTKFEDRGRRRGHGVWDLLYEKTG